MYISVTLGTAGIFRKMRFLVSELKQIRTWRSVSEKKKAFLVAPRFGERQLKLIFRVIIIIIMVMGAARTAGPRRAAPSTVSR